MTDARPAEMTDWQALVQLPDGALTRAIRSKDPPRIESACRAAVAAWAGTWPDDWSRWQRALDDSRPFSARLDLTEL